VDFYVIADQDTVVGFRYAGVRGVVVNSPEEAAAELDRLAAERADLIIITTQRIANSVRDRIAEIRYAGELPLVVEIPGPEGPDAESPSLVKMIREAVGIRF
jgi:V/A-type H+-transporting ATPase subunit F